MKNSSKPFSKSLSKPLSMLLPSLLWTIQISTVAIAFIDWMNTSALRDEVVLSEGQTAVKYIFLFVFLAFFCYTIYCGTREKFFVSIKKMAKLHWGWQAGIDLYLGLGLFIGLVFWQSASVAMAFVWMVLTLMFGNIITFLYLFTQFESLIVFIRNLNI